ncbi:MAG: DnaA-related protein [Gammaproteobacteria bacterium]|jgi:DnaA family protein|nr:DnaA-related protein [Gammaproteobacteria bacterium]
MLIWPEHATFDSFVPSQNAHLLAHLSDIVEGEAEFCTYLYALEGGLGLTHLLQATCRAVTQNGKAAAYFSFKDENLVPQALEGMETISLLCLDDIELAADQANWAETLFNLYHRLQDAQMHLLIAGRGLPKEMRWSLPDLQSRFAAASIFQVSSISDEEKIAVLQQRANARGLTLTQEVGQYLLSRFPRNMHALIDTLDILDRAALSAQRRLTIPFIKTVFS